jgi:hypothetical protein
MGKHSRGRDAAGHVDRFAERRQRYHGVMRALGVAKLFTTMPREIQELVWRRKYPDPVLEFDASVPKDGAWRELRSCVEKQFREAVIVVRGRDVTVRDVFSVMVGLSTATRDAVCDPNVPIVCRVFIDMVRNLLGEGFQQIQDAAFMAWHGQVVATLHGYSRLDGRLLHARPSVEPAENDKNRVRLTVSAVVPQQRSVKCKGRERPAYRVGTGNEWDGVHWASWDAAAMGLAKRGEWPVFVQSHALLRLRQRLNLKVLVPFLEYWLYASLAKPVVVERSGKDLLVEYAVQGERLGYLIVTPLPHQQLVAVRTFKFLTMGNTPEQRKLMKVFKMTRADVDWLRLASLETFTQTDLRYDPLLREKLEACGCGHLFTLDWAELVCQPQPVAAEMRKYLRLAA